MLARFTPAVILIALMASHSHASGSRPLPPEIWAVGDGEKILHDALDSPLKEGNSVWDGKRITLWASRNETIAFQLIVSALRGPVRVNSVSLAFTETELSECSEILSQHYLKVDTPSPSRGQGGWFWFDAAAPGMTGEIPDALIDLNAKPGRGGLPINVKKKTLQGFWIDVHVPRSFAAGHGTFSGELRLETNAGSFTLPVELEILDMTLPDEDIVKTMVPMGGIARRHGYQDPKLWHAYRTMAHRHRFDVVEHVSSTNMEDYRPYLDGSAYTMREGYIGPGQGIGHKVFAIDLYGSGRSIGGTEKETWKNMDAWANWFKRNAPDTLAFYYIYDEPPRKEFPQIVEKARMMKSNPGPGGKIPILLTKRPYPELEGAIDIWATVSNQVKLDEVAERKKRGERWWFYNGMRPMSGAVPLDAPAVDFRVQPWICWLYGVELWFYWESTHWQHNSQGPRARQDQDIFRDPATFVSRRNRKVNGDGTLFYPGEDTIYPDQDRGIKGPLSSIRMKNLRRGQQDVAYIKLAIAAGKEDAAREIARKLIPKAFSLAKRDEKVSWPEDGASWNQARREIADLALAGKARKGQP